MTATLRTELGLTAPDDFYEALIKAHEGLSPEASRKLNARLILLLANQVGDQALLEQVLAAAREGL